MEIITAFGFACIATMAFAVLFQAPKKIVLIDGVIGAIGWAFIRVCLPLLIMNIITELPFCLRQ